MLEADTTVTKPASVAPTAATDPGDPEKTTFVASAASFLDIFCVDLALHQDDEVNNERLKPVNDAKQEPDGRRERGKFAILLSALTEAFLGSERTSMRRAFWWGASFVAVVATLAFVLYLRGASEREVKNLFAGGEYARAATVAKKYLARHPDNVEIKALGGKRSSRGRCRQWLGFLKARDFDRAGAVLAGMKQLSSHNAEVQSFIARARVDGRS